jgi:glucose/arabinose dehydrogenase
VLLAGCSSEPPEPVAGEDYTPASFACQTDLGITLPDGFCGVVFADDLGRARHVAVRDNGDVFVATRPRGRAVGAPPPPPPIRVLRDADGDGRAEVQQDFGDPPAGGTGIGIHDGFLYFSTPAAVYRHRLTDDLLPDPEAELIVDGFPEQPDHQAKPFTFDRQGHIYVNVGAPSNACQREARTPGSPGLDPCPQLELQGGIWRFDAAAPGQTQQEHGVRHASGIRNAMALDWSERTDRLYVVQHGRDELARLWPEYSDDAQNAELPAEEMLIVRQGDDFGWPYCYWDPMRDGRVLAPEYGGDGHEVGRCAAFDQPIVAFPAHWAPNDLVFYEGEQFPARYRGGAFIAFHGSWNRSPLPQDGFRVVFVPLQDGLPAGDWEAFADGFSGPPPINLLDLVYRPTGVAVGPDGSLFIVDGERGRVWRIVYAPGAAGGGGDRDRP